uniref:Secreted protein n=1 Tax=Parascaris univalens TaxID=6257 RepID=A0A915AET6_PARUN
MRVCNRLIMINFAVFAEVFYVLLAFFKASALLTRQKGGQTVYFLYSSLTRKTRFIVFYILICYENTKGFFV